MAETLTIRTASSTEVVKIASVGPQGPKGDKGDPGDVAGLPLTTQGDTLYRGASQNERLPIGTSGQVLKVSAGGIPEWGAAPSGVSSWNDLTDKPSTFPPSTHTHTASDVTDFNAAAAAAAPVQSVNGSTGAVTVSVPTASSATPQALGVAAAGTSTDFARADHVHAMPSASDVGAAPATGIDPTAITGTAVVDNDARLSDSRTPSSHSSSHASAGSDPLAPSDIGAQSIFTTDSLVLSTSAEVTLTAGRAKIFDVLNFSGSDVDVVLPQAGNQVGDTFVFRWASGSNQILVRGVSAGSPVISLTSGERKRVIRGASNWSVVPVDTHTHAASQITSGTLTHERGGLEADVSAYNGLVKISGGSTSAVGIGTGSTEVAAGDHGHGNLTSDGKIGSTAGLPVVTTTAGAVTTLALGTAGQVLQVNSGATGVEFAAASGGGITNVDSTLADVMSVSGSNLVADDGGLVDSSNPALVWDDAAGKAAWANPLRRTAAGSFYVGLAPTTTALGTDAINIQANRNAATQVASGADAIGIGNRSRSSSTESVAIGFSTTASGVYSTCVGGRSTATGTYTTAVGHDADATMSGAIALGDRTLSSTAGGVAVGSQASATNDRGIAIGEQSSCASGYGISMGFLVSTGGVNGVSLNASSTLRAQFATLPFSAVYWGGQTTDATANVELNLDATATNRMTIAANTAVLADIYVVARQTDNSRFLAARRWVAIRRDGSNNTSLIGAVQDIGTDQSAGTPAWTFTIDADDTAAVESLRIRVTGTASQTVNWRVMALYRVVA